MSEYSEAEQHRRVLELGSGFNKAELKNAYLTLIQRWHPDRYSTRPGAQVVATEKSKVINVAYEYLTAYLENSEDDSPTSVWSRDKPSDTTTEAYNPRPRKRDGDRTQGSGFTNRTVTEVFLKSSHIVSTAYNRNTQTLYIKFGANSVVRYFDVPESVFKALLNAPSPGHYAHKHIYRVFRNEPCSGIPTSSNSTP